MLQLLAIAPEDGWAFVRDNGCLSLVRPPYTRSNVSPVSEKSLEASVTQHGFSIMEREFSTWKDLIEFLNQQVRQSREARGEAIQREGLGAQMLQHAPKDVLVRFLDRIQNELLPVGDWEPAERMLLDILKTPRVTQNPALVSRVHDLLERTRKGRRESENRRSTLLNQSRSLKESCPALESRFNLDDLEQFNQGIQARGQVLRVGV